MRTFSQLLTDMSRPFALSLAISGLTVMPSVLSAHCQVPWEFMMTTLALGYGRRCRTVIKAVTMMNELAGRPTSSRNSKCCDGYQ